MFQRRTVLAGLLVAAGILTALLRSVPRSYHDAVIRFHERARDTLYALDVLQAATAFGAFVVGWIVFWLLGYPRVFSLAVFAGPPAVVLLAECAELLSAATHSTQQQPD